MSKSDVPLVATGDWIDAAWLNQYLRDNIAAIWQGTNAGDIDYYLSGSAKNRLAIGPNLTTVLMPASGAPSWAHDPALKGILHASAAVYWTGEFTRTSSAYADVTGATVNIVTTQTCTIVMRAEGHIANGTAGNRTTVQGVINGTADAQNDDTKPWTTNSTYVPFSYEYRLTGVPAGTITCKLQFKAGGGTAYVNAGRIIVQAIVE